ncbi:LPXTG cell wall anchor domain-containing protein, partial [Collinsella aerofaciens]|uniref:LPXTG cell wall anchor domain-containing protein n=1 Tax=Collinsella aerofaciens TaxID=74426 RepID=UPI0034A367C0
PSLKPAAATTKTTTTVAKTTVSTSSKPKAATATTVALPKTGDSNWIAASFTLLLLGLGLLGAAYRCWGVRHT